MEDHEHQLLARHQIEKNERLAAKLQHLLEVLLPDGGLTVNDWTGVVRLLDPGGAGRVRLPRWVLVAMRGFSNAATSEAEGHTEGHTTLGAAEFTAVVWCALDPRERGSVEGGKMVAFLRAVAALETVGGGVMRAQALHRKLLEAFRLHAGGGGVQVMSELGRSKYNKEPSSTPVHSFAYKEDSGQVQVSWEALTGVSSVMEEGQKGKVRSVAVLAFQMTDTPSGLGDDWCEVLGIACVLINVATGLPVDEFHASVRPSNPKPLSALAQATACAQQVF